MNALMPLAMDHESQGKGTEIGKKHPHVKALDKLQGRIYMREVFDRTKLTEEPQNNDTISSSSRKSSQTLLQKAANRFEISKHRTWTDTPCGRGKQTSQFQWDFTVVPGELNDLDPNRKFTEMQFKGEISKPELVTLSREVCSAMDIPSNSAVAFFYPDPELSKSMLECEEDALCDELVPDLELQKQALIREWVDGKDSEKQALAMLLLSGGFVYFDTKNKRWPIPAAKIKAIINGIQDPDKDAALSIGKWELLPDSGDNEINSQQVGFPKMRENQFDKFAWVVHHLW